MTVKEIREFINTVDPLAKHHFTKLDGGSYTVWAETRRIGLDADNDYEELGWAFEIVRFTQNEFDKMPEKIERALLKNPLINYEYTVDSDPDSGYIVHTFVCEA